MAAEKQTLVLFVCSFDIYETSESTVVAF